MSETRKIIPFPPKLRARRPASENSSQAAGPAGYEFTEPELAALCRWFSAVGLYNRGAGAPNCLVAKHEAGDAARFFWSTEGDPPRVIRDLSEITDAHIRAIRPPRNEKGWLDPIGWMGVYATRMITTALQVV